MSRVAKLFPNGGSQAVRLPAEFRFDCEEVLVEKVGDVVTLRPVRKGWDTFFDDPRLAPPSFLADRHDEPAQTRDLF